MVFKNDRQRKAVMSKLKGKTPLEKLIMADYPSVDAEAELQVKRGYDEATRDLDFKTRPVSPEVAKRMAHIVGGYNQFDADNVSHAIDKIADVVGYIEFGRESSPVMYITIADDVKDVDRAVGKIRRAFKDALADEINLDAGLLETKVRVWWD